jgi:hypothetical protein
MLGTPIYGTAEPVPFVRQSFPASSGSVKTSFAVQIGKLNLGQDVVIVGIQETTESDSEATSGASISEYSAIEIPDPLPESRTSSLFQSSLRDFSMMHAYPGLRPGLSSAVPPGLIFAIARSQTMRLSTSDLLPFPLASSKQKDAG